MSIDFQKVAEAIEKSPLEIKNLMFSPKLGDKIGMIAEENHLTEEVAFKLFDEVGCVILGLTSRFSFKDSLVRIGVDKNQAEKIQKEVESKIFVELDKVKKTEPVKTEEKGSVPPKQESLQKERTNGVGDSFAQMLVNQARAMQPQSGGSREVQPHQNYTGQVVVSSIEKKVDNAPSNLPTGEQDKLHTADKLPVENQNFAAPKYVPGKDPYREPAE